MRYRRRDPLSFSGFCYRVGDGFGPALLICAAVVCIGYIVFAVVVGVHNDGTDNNASFEKVLRTQPGSHATREERQALAQRYLSLVQLEDHRLGKDSNYRYVVLSGDQLEQLQATAKTGRPAQLDIHDWSFAEPFGWPELPIEILILYLFVGSVSLSEFYDYESSYRLADMPWNRPWPWLVTVGLGPVFWIATAVSAILLRKNTQTYPVENPLPAPNDYRFDFDDDYYQPRRTTVEPALVAPPTKKYRSSPGVARGCYVNLRTKAAGHYQRQRLSELTFEINQYGRNAKELGADLRRMQRHLNQRKAERQRLEQSIDATEPVDPTVASEEFDRIMQLPGVLAVQVINDRLRIIVRAEHEYNGTRYDLGDWQIDLTPDSYHLVAKEIRTGLRRDWHGSYPAYRLGGETFCFGHRMQTIDDHVAKGQYLEALAVAIDCLDGVNPEDEHNVPRAFHALNV